LAPHPEYEKELPVISYKLPGKPEEYFARNTYEVPASGTDFKVVMQRIKMNERKNWQYFAPQPGKGEDVSFCERAKASGHQPYADPAVACLHVGTQPFGLHNVLFPPFEQAPGMPGPQAQNPPTLTASTDAASPPGMPVMAQRLEGVGSR
jgi:hypothetical protein